MTNRRWHSGVLAGMRSGVVATVVLLALAGCGAPPAALKTTALVRVQAAPAVPPKSTAIPWIDSPAPTYAPPQPLPAQPFPRKAPACAANQLTVANDSFSGRTSDRGVVLQLTNASRTTCLLLGTPHVVVWGPGYGPVVVTQHRVVGTSFDMAPRQSTYLWLSATADCLSGPAYGKAPIVDRLTISPHGGGVLTVPGLSMPRSCGGIGESNFYRNTPDPVYPPEPLAGSKVFLELPATPARAASVFSYDVVVRNPTTKPITMTPCPGYTEWLSVGGSDYPARQLNCDGHASLRPGQTLAFRMQLAIPADAPTGPATIAWSLQDGADKGSSRAIEIVGNDIPCHAGQLAASAPEAAVPFAMTGIYAPKDSGTTLTVTVTNTSTTLCTLQGAPTVAATSSNGKQVPLHWGDVGFNGQPPSPPQVRLAPGGSARTVLSWHAKWCGADPNRVTVDLGLPSGGGAVRVTPAHGWTPPACKGWDVPDQVSSTQFAAT